MKIKSISLTNFKSINGYWELDPVVLVHGPNCSGKTALALALKLACAGRLPPPLGKLGQSIYRLAGKPDDPGQMRVEITTTNKKLVWRSWTRNEKGSVSAESNLDEELITDALLDFRGVFLAKTGSERTALILEQCDFKYTANDLFDAIRQSGLDPDSEVVRKCVPMRGRGPARLWLDQVAKNVATAYKQAKLDAQVCAEAAARTVRSEPPRGDDHTQEISRLRHEIALAEERVASEARRKQLEENAATLARQLESLDEPSAIATKEALLTELETSRYTETSLVEQIAAFEATCNDLRVQLNELKVEQAKMESQAALIDKLRDAAFCPTCGALREHWTTKTQFDSDRLKALVEKRNQIEDKIGRAQAEIHKAIQSRNAILMKGKTIEIEIAKLNQRLDSIAGVKEKLALIKSELEGLKDVPSGALDEVRALQDKLVRLVQEQSRHDAWCDWKSKLDEANEQSAKATRTEAMLRKVNQILTEERQRLVAGSIGDYLRLANKCGGCLLPSPLQFHSERNEFGRMQNGGWVSLDTFSGFEEMIACAGLALAMSQASSIRLLVLDEMGRLTDDRKRDIAELMKQLVADDLLDNCIMIDVSPDPYETSGIQFIKFE